MVPASTCLSLSAPLIGCTGICQLLFRRCKAPQSWTSHSRSRYLRMSSEKIDLSEPQKLTDLTLIPFVRFNLDEVDLLRGQRVNSDRQTDLWRRLDLPSNRFVPHIELSPAVSSSSPVHGRQRRLNLVLDRFNCREISGRRQDRRSAGNVYALLSMFPPFLPSKLIFLPTRTCTLAFISHRTHTWSNCSSPARSGDLVRIGRHLDQTFRNEHCEISDGAEEPTNCLEKLKKIC